MSDPKHTFSVEDDGSVRIEIPSGVGVDVDVASLWKLRTKVQRDAGK